MSFFAAFPLQGIVFALSSGFFSSCGAAFVKELVGIHSLEVVIFRDIVQIIVCVVLIAKNGHSIKGVAGERKFMLLRAFWGTVSLSSWFCSVRLTAFGDASAIYYSYPPFITLLAWIFLREPFGWFNLIANILTLTGIIAISGPRYVYIIFGDTRHNFSDSDVYGLILATVGCFAVSCGNLSIRKLQKTPAPVVILWFSFISMVSSFVLLPIIDRFTAPADYEQYLMLLAVGTCGILTQVFITAALKAEKAAPVAICEAFNMIVAFIFQLVIFREPISFNSIVGAILIGVAVFAVGYKKWLDIKKESSMDVSQERDKVSSSSEEHYNSVKADSGLAEKQ